MSGRQMKEIELTRKAEEDMKAIWDYSFRQFGVIQADESIGRIAAVFDMIGMHEIGTQSAGLRHSRKTVITSVGKRIKRFKPGRSLALF